LPQIGFQFLIINNSSGSVTVNSSGANLVQTVAANSRALVTCVLLTGTSAASWTSTYVTTGGTISGLTTNTIPKATSATALGDSRITDNGTTLIAITTGSGDLQMGDLVSAANGTKLVLSDATRSLAPPALSGGVTLGTSGEGYTGLYITDVHANPTGKLTGVFSSARTFTFPNVSGTVALTTPTINAQVGTTYTLLASDNGGIVTLNNGSGITVTVPSGLGAGFNCVCVQLGAGQVTFTGSGATVNNRQSHTKIAAQYGEVSLVAYAANTFVLAGDTAA
jgi:hypothetical protein